jgi:hypothetical protein
MSKRLWYGIIGARFPPRIRSGCPGFFTCDDIYGALLAAGPGLFNTGAPAASVAVK